MPTTNARTRRAWRGYRIIRRLDADPDEAALDGGEMWFRTDTEEWRGYDGADFVTFDVTVDQ